MPLPHIKIEGYAHTNQYISPKSGRPLKIKAQSRRTHGSKILDHIKRIQERFDSLEEVDLPDGIVRDDAMYVEFISEFDFEPAFESLDSEAKSPKYLLLNIKKEKTDEGKRYRINVMLTEGGISHFLKKAKKYMSENNLFSYKPGD